MQEITHVLETFATFDIVKTVTEGNGWENI